MAGGSAGVVDSDGLPAGNAMVRSEGGLLLVTDSELLRKYNGTAAGMGAGASQSLMVGQSGEPSARFAVDANGSMHWGNGAASQFTTTVRSPRSASVSWDPPALAAGAVATIEVEVPGAAPGSLCAVSHEAAGAAFAESGGGLPVLSGFVSSPGKVLTVLKNEGGAALNVGEGKLSVVATMVE